MKTYKTYSYKGFTIVRNPKYYESYQVWMNDKSFRFLKDAKKSIDEELAKLEPKRDNSTLLLGQAKILLDSLNSK